MKDQIPLAISCATNRELHAMIVKDTGLIGRGYWLDMAIHEFDKRAEVIVCESVEQYTEDGFTVEHHVNDEYIGSHPLWIEFMGNRFIN